MAKVKRKGVGDTTSFTIPERFTHILTGEKIDVTKEMLNFLNEHIENRNLVHALMSVIYMQVHEGETKGKDFDKLEKKLDALLEVIQSGVTVQVTSPKTTDIDEIDDDLDDLLSEHTR